MVAYIADGDNSMQATEHIVLEAETREVPQLQSRRRVHASLRCRSRLRRRSLHLSIIDYYYLGIRVGQSGAAAREYVLDLRFVDPSFALTRHIPWRCIWTALALTAAAGAGAMWYAADTVSRLRHLAAEVSATLFAGATLAYLVVAVRLVETVALHSLHGRAAVLEYRGGAGTLRRIPPIHAQARGSCATSPQRAVPPGPSSCAMSCANTID